MFKPKKPPTLSKEDFLKLPVHEREDYVKETIRKTINQNLNGVTSKQLIKLLGFDARAVDKHLSVMLHTNEIYTVQYDQTKVYLPNGRAMHSIIEESFDLGGGKTLGIYQLRNRLGEFVYMQEKEETDHRIDTGGGILIPLEKYPEFVDYQKKSLTALLRSGIR